MACLWIIRHADAEKDNYENDFERDITPDGRKEAIASREKFLQKCDQVGLALVSSAKRTQQTADLLTFPMGWSRQNLDQLYECQITDALQLLAEKLKNCTSEVALVGHNPFVSNFCSYLCGDFINLKTANICRLKIEEKDFKIALILKGCWDLKLL